MQCGVANQMSSRIVAGSVVTPNEFPWMAFLRITFWSGDSAMCGGTVIDGRWILTAAHCTFGAVSITVILGAHDITLSSSDVNRQEFTSHKWIVHPSWSYGDVENDIAIIELPFPATFSGMPLIKFDLHFFKVDRLNIFQRICPTGLSSICGWS